MVDRACARSVWGCVNSGSAESRIGSFWLFFFEGIVNQSQLSFFVPERTEDRVRRDEVVLADPVVVEAAEGSEQGGGDGRAPCRCRRENVLVSSVAAAARDV